MLTDGNHFILNAKWFGPHAEYDRIDAATVQYKRKITMELK
ncbi:MAG: hypothetical protein ABW019_13980 [Chitinophagaceae bacterium]